MKKSIVLLLCLFAVGCTAAKKNVNSGSIIQPSVLMEMSASEVETTLIKGHPANYFTVAAMRFSENKKQEAAKWLYVGQIRYRAYLQANPTLPPSGDPALFSALIHEVGRPLNEYIAGDIDEWVATIDEAILWHKDNPYDFVDKEQHKAIYEDQLSGLEELKQTIIETQDTIRKKRAANGLENRY